MVLTCTVDGKKYGSRITVPTDIRNCFEFIARSRDLADRIACKVLKDIYGDDALRRCREESKRSHQK